MKCLGIFVSGFILVGSAFSRADDDTGIITVTLDAPAPPDLFVPVYRLAGQSAFIESVTTGSTSGGQLNNVSTPGAVLTNPQFFPQALLSDYLTFTYFGLVQTTDGVDTVDTSLVVALKPGFGVGVKFDDLFPTNVFPLDEASVVTALATTTDSETFMEIYERLTASTMSNGIIALPQQARLGETLNLIAFIGGPDGDLGVNIGTLTDSITRVPEPATLGLLATAGMLSLRRRRSAR